jgi:hypothetical protein
MIYFDFVLVLPLSTTKQNLYKILVLVNRISHLSYSHTEILRLGVAVVWIGQLVPDLSLQRPMFDPKPVFVGFVVHMVILGHVVSLSTFIFPCQYYPTTDPHSYCIYLSTTLYNCSI